GYESKFMVKWWMNLVLEVWNSRRALKMIWEVKSVSWRRSAALSSMTQSLTIQKCQIPVKVSNSSVSQTKYHAFNAVTRSKDFKPHPSSSAPRR
ncbi:hypothetical protein HAX54_020663, partial [Datura stramonium]|nr:hypothetical protein [Datura stramonium]